MTNEYFPGNQASAGGVTQLSNADGFIGVSAATGPVVLSEGAALASALALLAPLASPALTGTPTAPTQAPLTSNTDIATTAYADAAVTVEKNRAQAAEALLAPLASPALTGTPTAPTKAALTNNTDIATTAYTDAAVGVETTRATGVEALKAPLASPALTGTPTAPTQAALTNNTDIATTAYTDAAVLVEKNRATTAEGLLGSPSLSDTTMIGLNGPTATVSVGLANDCAFFSFVASVSDTIKTIEGFTGATFAGTNNTDIAIYSLNTSTGVLTLLWSHGVGTENAIWGTPGVSAHATTSVNGGTGVAVTQGNIYFIGCYMASAADGFRGSNGMMSGARLRGYNGLAYGKLAGQSNCPTASFNISTLIAIGYGFLFNMLPY